MFKTCLGRFGYQISKVPTGYDDSRGYTLYRYVTKDGTFDYESYRQVQVDGNRKKLDDVWVREENIEFLAQYIRNRVGTPRFGLCHGTRRGLEQAWFSKRLTCQVLGTDIADTAEQFPNTIQWDFHNVKQEWLGAADFIYSNAFDHSYDPEKCLNAWMSCVRPGGLCILEHSSAHGPSGTSLLDPFGADLLQMPYLIATWGKGTYCVREILPAPVKHDTLHYLSFLVIQKF
jgi:hypothetical protein